MGEFINIKESLMKVINDNNLEILKIDLCDSDAAFAKFMNTEFTESCETYTTLESLDFKTDPIYWHDEVCGMVYCRDKDTKEPVWIVSRGDEGGSWWEVNRVPEFYKNQLKH